MNNLDLLIQAIDIRSPISFEYNKPGKSYGKRIGNPYAIFILTTEMGSQSTKVHVLQTSGVSDSKHINPLPDFRTFNLQDMSRIQILENEQKFIADHHKYNPEWEGYKNVIAKV